jgi:DNA repair protein RadC
MANLSNPPRNCIGDRAGPRYALKTFKLTLRACEPGATVDSSNAAVPVLRQILSRLDTDQEHFILLALSTQLRITGFKVVASGGMEGIVVDT